MTRYHMHARTPLLANMHHSSTLAAVSAPGWLPRPHPRTHAVPSFPAADPTSTNRLPTGPPSGARRMRGRNRRVQAASPNTFTCWGMIEAASPRCGGLQALLCARRSERHQQVTPSRCAESVWVPAVTYMPHTRRSPSTCLVQKRTTLLHTGTCQSKSPTLKHFSQCCCVISSTGPTCTGTTPGPTT